MVNTPDRLSEPTVTFLSEATFIKQFSEEKWYANRYFTYDDAKARFNDVIEDLGPDANILLVKLADGGDEGQWIVCTEIASSHKIQLGRIRSS